MYPTMLYLLTETLSYYNIVTPSNNNNNNSSSNRLFSSDESNAALIRWLFHTTLFPGIVLFMAIYLQNNTASPSSNASKWIHSCSSVLASAIAIYLTLMVLIECTVRVVLFQAGIGTAIDPSAIDNAYQQQEKHAAALDRCMERSLLQRDIGETETGAASTSVSRCCGNQQDSNHATSTSTAAATATSATILSGSYNNSCAICLEDFQVGDTVVSGRKDCCKSNVFHESCIKQWLRIQDSCPCCRQAMLERRTETDPRAGRYESANTSASSDGGEHSSFRSQFRIKIDTVTRMRNEILSYYVEGTATTTENRI